MAMAQTVSLDDLQWTFNKVNFYCSQEVLDLMKQKLGLGRDDDDTPYTDEQKQHMTLFCTKVYLKHYKPREGWNMDHSREEWNKAIRQILLDMESD